MRDEMSVLTLIEGPGHLWFLPMLFWCFLIGWCILQTKLSPKIVLPVLYLVSLIRPVELPLRLSQALYYLPFFFLGYYIYAYYDWLKDRIKAWHLPISWGLFILTYCGSVLVNDLLSIGYRGAIMQIDLCDTRSIGSFAKRCSCNQQAQDQKLVCEFREPMHGGVYLPTVYPSGALLSYSASFSGICLGFTIDRFFHRSSALPGSILHNQTEQRW